MRPSGALSAEPDPHAAYSSIQVANRFLELAGQEGRPLTPMQIQKLVYIAHGWHLGYTGEPLCSEDVQAWVFGPVFPDLYEAAEEYGRNPIEELLGDAGTAVVPDDGSFASELIDALWPMYRDYTAAQLSSLTHAQGTPWAKTRRGGGKPVIPTPSIKQHYEEKLSDARA